jgi:hypothetical protein
LKETEMANTNHSDDVDVVEKVAKRKSITLTSGTSKLTILAQRKADGAVTTVTTTDVKTKVAQRGMTKRFESFDLAVEALAKLEKEAVAKGWRRAERSGGFTARPDAFSTLPSPPKAKVSK